LSGANEVPATGSTGSGFVFITLSGNTLSISLVYSGLTAPTSAGHIHCCALPGSNAPVALPFSGLPSGTSGNYTNTFDLLNAASYTSAFVTASGGTAAGAEAALLAGMNSNTTYANLHDSIFPGGEIRGQIFPVPEPSSLLLGLLTAAGFVGIRSSRKARV
jgi:hypothetical protein